MDNAGWLKVTVSGPGLPELVKWWLLIVFSAMGLLTLTTHLAQLIGISFSTYAFFCALAVVVSITVCSRPKLGKLFGQVRKQYPKTTAALLLCSLSFGLLALTAYSPDLDDAIYVPNVVYYLENPAEPMDFRNHFVDSGEEPFFSPHLGSLPFEYSIGAFSHLLGIPFLAGYYLLAPLFWGCMIPLVWYYLISRFSFSSSSAIWGTFILCLGLTLLGEQHRSFGNFSFNRIFQGKAVMFSIGLPLFTALTIDFFKDSNFRNWFAIFVISIAMVGFSTSSAVLVPMLSFLVGTASCLSYVATVKTRLLRLTQYFCSLLYPVVYAMGVLFISSRYLSPDEKTLQVQLSFYKNTVKVLGGTMVLCSLAIGTALALIFLRKNDRNMLIIWSVLLFVCFLNPLVMPLIAKYVTTPIIYWRIFYLMPFPLVLGISAAGLASLLKGRSAKMMNFLMASIALVLLLAHLPPSSSSVFRHGPRPTQLGLPSYKIADLSYTNRVMSLAPPPGTMLAPSTISTTLPMLTSSYPQIIVRPHTIKIWMTSAGTPDKAIHRKRAQQFVQGKYSRRNFDSFSLVVQHNPQIRSIVFLHLSNHVIKPQVTKFMREQGFQETMTTDILKIFIRRKSESQAVKKQTFGD